MRLQTQVLGMHHNSARISAHYKHWASSLEHSNVWKHYLFKLLAYNLTAAGEGSERVGRVMGEL